MHFDNGLFEKIRKQNIIQKRKKKVGGVAIKIKTVQG